MNLTIAGKLWKIVRKPLIDQWGYCEHPETPGRKIFLHDKMSSKKELEILIHEIIHAGDWSIPESRVQDISKAACRALWRLGWRKENECQES